MKEIQLTQGKVALVDDEDFEYLSQWKWFAHFRHSWYAVRSKKIKRVNYTIKMHRFILGVTDPKILIDHKDHDPLNNQRSNLRIANDYQNACNKRSAKSATSKYLGVCRIKTSNKFLAQIMKDRKQNYLGLFEKEEDAAMAYNAAALKLHGEFASLNVIANE
jgi:hypothetical protein